MPKALRNTALRSPAQHAHRRGTKRACALSVALAVALTGCVRQVCSDASCDSGISAKVNGELPGADKRVTSCLDGDCLAVDWPLGSLCSSTQSETLELSVCLRDDGTIIRLLLAPQVATNGAVFEISVVDGDGSEVFHAGETVRYSNAYPNGEDCPGRCRYANFRY